LESLAAHGFTTLDVQCGPDLEYFRERIINLSNEEKHGVSVRYFGYTETMNAHMMACRGELNVRLAGCVISHAGKFASVSLPKTLRFMSADVSSQELELSWRCKASVPH
jgi:beta-1,4-N-acetylglucosaminyltransferase